MSAEEVNPVSDSADKKAPAKAPKVVMQSPRDWAAKKSVPLWAVNVTASRVKWELDPQCGLSLVSEADFDSAVSETLSARLG